MGAVLGHDRGDDALRRAFGEQRPGDLLDHPPGRPLRHADRDRSPTDDLDIAALERRQPEVVDIEAVVVAELRVPELEAAALEHRVGPVDRGHVECLAAAGRPVHRVDRDAAVDPARRVASEQRVRQGRQDERRLVVDRRGDQRRLPERRQVEAGLADGQAADEVPGQLIRGGSRAAPGQARRGPCRQRTPRRRHR